MTILSNTRKTKLPTGAPQPQEPSRPQPKAKSEPDPGIAAQAPMKKAAPVEAPTKNGKLKKVPATLSKNDLQYFRNLLLEKRSEILGDVGSMESDAFKGGDIHSNMPTHMADVGTDNYEQEFTLGLIESERKFLREIQDAVIRVDQGTFGICEGTGQAIPRVRLEAVPWAKHTIEHSRLLESGKIARKNDTDTKDAGGDKEDEE